MDGLEERQTGRGSDGLVRWREYRCDETSRDVKSRKGKGKGTGGKGEHDSSGGEFGGKGVARTTKNDDKVKSGFKWIWGKEKQKRRRKEHEG